CPRRNATQPRWPCRPQPAPTTSTSTCRDPSAAGEYPARSPGPLHRHSARRRTVPGARRRGNVRLPSPRRGRPASADRGPAPAAPDAAVRRLLRVAGSQGNAPRVRRAVRWTPWNCPRAVPGGLLAVPQGSDHRVPEPLKAVEDSLRVVRSQVERRAGHGEDRDYQWLPGGVQLLDEGHDAVVLDVIAVSTLTSRTYGAGTAPLSSLTGICAMAGARQPGHRRGRSCERSCPGPPVPRLPAIACGP